jgi:hypothetical protein
MRRSLMRLQKEAELEQGKYDDETMEEARQED